MTRDEAFKKLEQTIGLYLMNGNADDTYCREWREILETLKSESCEDRISRQAVLDVVSNPLNIRLEEIIEKLPSVTPQEPKTDVLDKIRAEIESITDTMGVNYNQYLSKIEVLQIIDKYRQEG